MHQLRALIWKTYKLRLRSPVSTTLDIAGPIVVFIVYLCLKLIIGSLTNINLDPSIASNNYFRNTRTDSIIDVRRDIGRYMCNKVLFYGVGSTGVQQTISRQCGIELVASKSEEDLVERLKDSLNYRIGHKQKFTDLNKSNSTPSCYILPGAKEPSYQAGIVLNRQGLFEIYTTELAGSQVTHMPYAQGSPYNEYRFPQSDLNSGIHLLEICLATTFKTKTTADFATSSPPSVSNISLVVNTKQDVNITIIKDNNTQQADLASNKLKWRLKAFPTITGSHIVPVMGMLTILIAHFCNVLATVTRVSEVNELGLHRYIRTAGVPAGIYWLSQMITTLIHMIFQSLILALLLALPSSDVLFDPISESNITIRWILLLSYSLSINAHAMFIGSLFDRSSHALLVTCLLASGYSMFALSIMVQWTPYGFSSFSPVIVISMLNPASNFEALLLVIYAVTMQTNEPFNWSHLSEGVIGGGISDWSVGAIWSLLVIQGLVWFLATILIDQLHYTSTKGIISLPIAFMNELFSCNKCGPQGDRLVEDVKTRSAVGLKSAQSKKDPNRICCSLSHISVAGPSVMMAHTRSDPLRFSKDQLKSIKNLNGKTQQYLINRTLSGPNKSPEKGPIQQEAPVLLDEAIEQHMVWSKTPINYNDLNLDFRFNQVSFILGQTDLKDLLFSTLLGLRSLDSGHIILDEAIYTGATIGLARPHLGYLGERDIYFTEMSIFENLQFFGSLRDPSYKGFDSESSFVLSLLHLSSRKDSMPTTLTNRSARKLALAVAAVGHTKLLLLVEPTLNLRWKPRCQVLNLLRKYKSIRSILVDTSDVDEATAFGDRIVLLKEGGADLDGTPDRLRKKLACGYRIVFERVTENGRDIKPGDIKKLGKVVEEIFEQDKLDFQPTSTGSFYRGLQTKKEARNTSKTSQQIKSPGELLVKPHKAGMVLKVQQTDRSNQNLCKILNMFNKNKNIHGFRLVELTYESLEDILVLRMSRAMYPDLPPDLLLSLQHRTDQRRSTPPPVSVRQLSSSLQVPKTSKPVSSARLVLLLKDRVGNFTEMSLIILAMISALIIVGLSLVVLRSTLMTESNIHLTRGGAATSQALAITNRYSDIEQLYKHRIGFYVINNGAESLKQNMTAYLSQWRGNKDFIGFINRDTNQTDANFVATFIQKSKDVAVSLIVFDPQTSETTVIFEPYLAHAMLASIRTFINYDHNYLHAMSDSSNTNQIGSTAKQGNRDRLFSVKSFTQSWHEMIHGFLDRRFIFGLGFATAEGIVLGVLVIAPIRHRSESRVIKVRPTYWVSMAVFDLMISMIVIVGYMVLFSIIEGIQTVSLILAIFIVFFLYKLASLPIPYLVSLAAESSLNGFLFIMLIYFTIGWEFSIHLKTFMEWSLIGENYLYAISTWIILAIPISSLIDSLTLISQIARINSLCDQVPAFIPTTNTADLDGIQRYSVVDNLLEKVRECLANGKSGISVDVLHQQNFGILWNIYLMIFFGFVAWTFLLTSEKFFGIVARRFNSARTSHDPMKTVIRYPDNTGSLFHWDKERDRLVSQYIRCLNEIKYVRSMANNCLFLRIWLKPLSDQSSLDKKLSNLLEPLYGLGQTKNEIQVELKTTLQLFVRIGDESKHCKMDKVKLIETYTNFAATHSDTIAHFAVVDWTRETFYKILLHGHYNAKSTTNII